MKQCIPAVPLIGKNVVDSRDIPLGVSETSGNLACGEVIGNCLFAFPGKKTRENLLNNESLFRMGKKFSIFYGVTKGGATP